MKPQQATLLLAIGLIGSVFPDVDLAYFYLFDQRQYHHHSYWTHVPVYWVVILCGGLTLAHLLRSRLLAAASIVLVGSVLLHLLLDTELGAIRWLYPFSTKSFPLFIVPARYDWTLLSFVLHWTFLFELVIVGASFFVYRMHSKQHGRFRGINNGSLFGRKEDSSCLPDGKNISGKGADVY